jgi:hypothetical protein
VKIFTRAFSNFHKKFFSQPPVLHTLTHSGGDFSPLPPVFLLLFPGKAGIMEDADIVKESTMLPSNPLNLFYGG